MIDRNSDSLHHVVLYGLPGKDNEFQNAIRILEILHRRCHCKVTLVTGSVTALGRKRLAECLESGIITSIFFSGHSKYIFFDAVNAARRVSAAESILVPWAALLMSPVEFLRRVITRQASRDPILYCATSEVFFCTKKELSYIGTPLSWEDASSWAHRSVAAARRRGVSISFLNTNKLARSSPTYRDNELAEGAELYVTEAGLRRFGGLQRLAGQGLRFAGVPLSHYKSFVALRLEGATSATFDTQGDPDDIVTHFPSTYTTARDETYVFDVLPAKTFDTSEDPRPSVSIALPRQILHIQRVAEHVTATATKTAIFIVSNYNKASHIAAAVYSMLMQSYPLIKICFTDDCSTDESIVVVHQLKSLLCDSSACLIVQQNNRNFGTYWIRNEVLHKESGDNVFFLVNDSDDVSSLQRATIQNAYLAEREDALGVFLDIVRIDPQHDILSLGDEVERYGTASLALRGDAVGRVGYFETLKKNADTEFIERTKLLLGPRALRWMRYPCLFQVFDGNNLTADIYTSANAGPSLTQNQNTRAHHTVLYRKRHSSLGKQVQGSYSFPHSTVPQAYSELGSSFLVTGYEAPDELLIVTRSSQGVCQRLANRGAFIIQLPSSNQATGKGKITIFRRKECFSSNMSLKDSMEWTLSNFEFHGYVLVTDNTGIIAVAGRDGLAIEHLWSPILELKRQNDECVAFLKANPSAPGHLSVMVKPSFYSSLPSSDFMFHTKIRRSFWPLADVC